MNPKSTSLQNFIKYVTSQEISENTKYDLYLYPKCLVVTKNEDINEMEKIHQSDKPIQIFTTP